MGANTSALLSEEIDEISRHTNLQQREVKRLYKRFQRLDRTHSGTLDAATLLMVPELAMNPLHPRLLDIFQNVNFRQFVTIMGAFSARADAALKLDFTFRVYDVDADGFICLQDLRHVLSLLVGQHMPPHLVSKLAANVIADADTDGDGRISPLEFAAAMHLPDLARKLSVPL
ncbi:unnamed protein product [Agarophyton chilense]